MFHETVHDLGAQTSDARRVPGVAGVELRVFTGISLDPARKGWLADVVARRVGAATGAA